MTRDPARRRSMFLRMLIRAALLRRGRAASALTAMVVAAAVATAVLNLFQDAQAKLNQEFRGYGANVIIVAKDGRPLPKDAFSHVQSAIGKTDLAVPFGYVVARTRKGQPIVVAGTDFGLVQKLDRWWSVTAWPEKSGDALLGSRALALVSPDHRPFELSFQGRVIGVSPAGVVETGASENSRVYLSLADFELWTGLRPSTMEVAISGSPDQVSASLVRLAAAVPAADVRPIRQIMEGEAHVLGKTKATFVASATLIIATAALCVLATLMGWVYDRRRDFAIMKALGASERMLNLFFAAEAAALGTAGAIVGFFIGIGVAAWIGRVNFHAPVVPRFAILPIVVAGSVTVALASAILPISVLRRVEPANILRGE